MLSQSKTMMCIAMNVLLKPECNGSIKKKRTPKLTYKSKSKKIKFSDGTITSMIYFIQNIPAKLAPSKNWALLWEVGANAGEIKVE